MKATIITGAILSLSLLSSSAAFAEQTGSANDTFTPNWYAGIGFIAPETDTNSSTGYANQTPTSTLVHDKSQAGWGVTAGYRASKYWAAEGAVYNQGHWTWDKTKTGSNTVFSSMAGQYYTTAASILAFIPFGNSPFAAYGRFGAAYTFSKNEGNYASVNGTTTTNDTGNDSENYSGFLYGFGVQYENAQSPIGARVDYLLFDSDSLNEGLDDGRVMVSAYYRF